MWVVAHIPTHPPFFLPQPLIYPSRSTHYNLKVFYSFMCFVLFPSWLPNWDVSPMRTGTLLVTFTVVCPVPGTKWALSKYLLNLIYI